MSKASIWHYIKGYIPFILLAVLFMCGEVAMDLLQPALMRRIIDEGVLGLGAGDSGGAAIVLKLGGIMLCLVLAGGAFGSLNNLFVNLTSQNAGNQMRIDSFSRIMGLSLSQADKAGTGPLVTRMTNDITQVQNMISLFIRGEVRTLALLGGSLFLMYRLNAIFGLIVTCALPILLGCLALCIARVNPLFTRLQERLDALNDIMQEDISGIRVIKACVRETYEQARFGNANSRLIATQLSILVTFAFMHPAMQVIMHAITVLILYFGFGLFHQGKVTPGAIMAAIAYTTQLLGAMLMLTMLFQGITRGRASWKRVRKLLDTPQDIIDGDEARPPQNEMGHIVFKDVSFRYKGLGKDVLNGISLEILPGQTIGIIGGTGCGKSTLLNLIPRFYDADEGQILVDGIDVRQYRQQDLRDRIAYALQKPQLFNMSIRDNISLGNDLGDERIREAASIAHALEFIEKMPEGFGTKAEERGARLSGGQKQRIALARALAKPAEILLLDDATSALDLQTEAAFYKALAKARPNLSTIIVAQRIASIIRADKIVILDNGRIVDQGRHEELLGRCRIYQEICQSQLGEEELGDE